MQKTMEVIKNKGIIEKLQKIFNDHKPPVGTPEEVFKNAIGKALCFELDNSEEFEDEFFEAIVDDAVQHIRKELNIEFVDEKEFLANALPKELVEMIEKLEGTCASVHVHVVNLCGEKKGQGEE